MRRQLGRARRWLGRQRDALRRRAVILMYHRVAETASDPSGLCVSPENFHAQMEHVRRHHPVVSLERLKGLQERRGIPRGTVVVTFDDGYADNLLQAKPVLERHEVPATLFLVTGEIGRDRLFWWDEVEQLVLLNPDLPDQVRFTWNEHTFIWDFAAAPRGETERKWLRHEKPETPRQQAYCDLMQLLGPLGTEDREAVLDRLRPYGRAMRAGESPARRLDLEEIGRFLEGGLTAVGAHTVTHTALSSLSPDRQRWEMLQSKRTLEDVAGQPVPAFSYPFGDTGRPEQGVARLAREVGFTLACAVSPRCVSSATDPFMLPRFYVGDWDGEMFARRLNNFFSAPSA